MTFIERVDAVAARFLSSRAYELIVAPAIADVQYDGDAGGPLARARNRVALLVALAGAAYEDLTTDSSVPMLAGLALIPAAYYTFLVLFCLPRGAMNPASEIVGFLSASTQHLGLVALLVAMSCAPVIACCWPDKKDA